MRITITTDAPRLYSLLKWEIPAGAKITSEPPMEYRGFEVNVSINIELVIDVYKISVPLVSAWLFNRCVLQKGKHQINIEGKQAPIDQSEIEQELQQAIENEKGQND